MSNSNVLAQGGNVFIIKDELEEESPLVPKVTNKASFNNELYDFFFTPNNRIWLVAIYGAVLFAAFMVFFFSPTRASTMFTHETPVVDIAQQGFVYKSSPSVITLLSVLIVPIGVVGFLFTLLCRGRIAWVIPPLIFGALFFAPPYPSESNNVTAWAEARYGISMSEIPSKNLVNVPFVNTAKTQALVFHAKPENANVLYLYDFVTDKELPVKNTGK